MDAITAFRRHPGLSFESSYPAQNDVNMKWLGRENLQLLEQEVGHVQAEDKSNILQYRNSIWDNKQGLSLAMHSYHNGCRNYSVLNYFCLWKKLA